MKHLHSIITIWALLALFAGCSDYLFNDVEQNSNQRITLAGDIDQLCVTRVNDNGFANGDVMGVYIVDYDGNTPGVLKLSGNRGDNVRHTYDETNAKWNSDYDLYWKDKHTHIDVYGYYPYGKPDNINDYQFTVQRDQSQPTADGEMGGYEQSDFLWGKVSDVAPTTSVIHLPMQHRMGCARVTLQQGSGFASGEWTSTSKVVLVSNLIRKATIDMSTGIVAASGSVESTSTLPAQVGDEWRAIVVPQAVKAGATLFTITIGGTPYNFKKNTDFTYLSGKMSNFTIRVDKKEGSGQYHLTLVSESITPWENDLVSHNAQAKEYVVIHSEAGKLRECIEAAHKDWRTLKNLKLTGSINSKDCYFMRDSMDNLSALNMKEVSVSGHMGYKPWIKGDAANDWEEHPGVLTAQAFNEKTSLLSVVLPDKLTGIGELAFRSCVNLSGSLYIPEGVTEIGASAFMWDKSLTGTLSLPSTLEYIGGGGAADRGGAFSECQFNCELILPEKLKYIGHNVFSGNPNFYGNLKLPSNLEFIGDNAFAGDQNLTGNLEIPDKITFISQDAFNGTGFNGTLKLPAGLKNIQNGAFGGVPLKGELDLPKNLTSIGSDAFNGCDFSGTLKLPKHLISIGRSVFANNWRLMGIVEFPEGLLSIGAGAFANCRSLEGLVFPSTLESIGYEATWGDNGGAFANCYGIGSIVCKGTEPAHVMEGAFNGVAKDNFTLEVPESSITQYQAASGWKDFKRIAAHHELVCRPSVACAINTEHKQTLTLNAEGDWEVASKPDWCELSQMSGSKKTELTLTIKAMAKGSANRTGNIVFKLKDKDYTHTCKVSQYNYEYGEDQYITLQKATKGNRGGINIVLLGDGYDAKDISEGNYLKDMKQEMEYFFAIEPYKTYRAYFNVYTAFPVSTETGVGTVNTIRYNRFNTTFTGGVGLRADYDEIFSYALNAPTVNKDNLNQTLIIMVPNTSDYGGICQMWDDGSAIAFCPKSTYGYPLDTRGVVQHEAGGHGFGKLADEYIYHNAFIDACQCTCCPHDGELRAAHAKGWFYNLSLTNKMHEVPWAHLIYDKRYSDIVDVFEGGFMHSRGVYRSELNSCMNNDIPYYSTISRELIVKRIMQYAGESYTFEKFVANDKRDVNVLTRAISQGHYRSAGSFESAPRIHRGSPLQSLARRAARRHRK